MDSNYLGFVAWGLVTDHLPELEQLTDAIKHVKLQNNRRFAFIGQQCVPIETVKKGLH
jgi:hypothetical protein